MDEDASKGEEARQEDGGEGACVTGLRGDLAGDQVGAGGHLDDLKGRKGVRGDDSPFLSIHALLTDRLKPKKDPTKQRGRETSSHIARSARMVVKGTAAEEWREARTMSKKRKMVTTKPGQKRPVRSTLVFQWTPPKNL